MKNSTKYFIVSVTVVPGDKAADHRVLLVVAMVVGAVERKVVKSGEVALDAVDE
ncbi:MAG TPA: hypothetical protein VED59_00850 [Acidimicrobiales bacterium]|nr:hypothetical protein [Acidimicrobiales bacterium]